jgi:hypothetical protein
MKNIYEIFDEYELLESKEERIYFLRDNQSFALKSVLQGTYSPNVQFTIEKMPNYKPSDSPPGLSYSSIQQELGRAYLFEANNPRVPAGLSQKRKEEILIQMLEVLEKRESEVFMNMLLKKQKVKGLDAKIVHEAFPDLW